MLFSLSLVVLVSHTGTVTLSLRPLTTDSVPSRLSVSTQEVRVQGRAVPRARGPLAASPGAWRPEVRVDVDSGGAARRM